MNIYISKFVSIPLKKQFVKIRKIEVAVLLIKHRPVPGRASSGARTRIGRFVKRFMKVPGACQTSYDARPGTGRAPLESYDIDIKQKSSGARPMCENAGRAPSGHRAVPGRCDFTLSDPTKRRTGAVEF